MSLAITRSVSGSTTTAGVFQALSALGAATVSSSFTVPTNVSSIKNITISFAVDAVEEFCGLVKMTGNAMRDGDAVFNAGGQTAMPSSTGSNLMYVSIDTDLKVQPGNSVSYEIATTQVATIDCVVTCQFA
jgi:hypothetical protein